MGSNEYMNEYMKKRYEKRRSEAVIKLGGKCASCASTSNLHIHHKDPSQKSFTLAKGSSYSAQRWDAEVAKCILLCEACHTLQHQSQYKCGTPHRYWTGCRCKRCTLANREYNKEYRRNRSAT